MAGFANFILSFCCPQAVYPKVESRNWVDLPESVTLRIFSKLETTEIFIAVRHVCSSWRKLSKEPVLYRSVVLGSKGMFINRSTGLLTELNFSKLLKEAVALSCGQMIQFSCGVTKDLVKVDLLHVAFSSISGLKSLRLGFSCSLNAGALTEVITSISSLEEVYYSYEVIRDSSIEKIGRSCPRLKYFWCRVYLSRSNKEAFAIAKNMPGLRRLCLYGLELTNYGVQAILDGCPHLEYLYLLGCFHIDLEDVDFWNKKQVSGRIKSKRLLTKTNLRECEFNLKTLLGNDDKQSFSKPLPSNTYPAENMGDYGLYRYTSQFVDSIQTKLCPRTPFLYDLFMKVEAYMK